VVAIDSKRIAQSFFFESFIIAFPHFVAECKHYGQTAWVLGNKNVMRGESNAPVLSKFNSIILAFSERIPDLSCNFLGFDIRAAVRLNVQDKVKQIL
jgi:hypothetical protein